MPVLLWQRGTREREVAEDPPWLLLPKLQEAFKAWLHLRNELSREKHQEEHRGQPSLTLLLPWVVYVMTCTNSNGFDNKLFPNLQVPSC
jgi:hypothetical protein